MAAGIFALALAFPQQVRTNAYWLENYPEVVAKAREKTLNRLWKEGDSLNPLAGLFEAELKPYLADPFRGTVERRVLGQGETSLSLELEAAKKALDIAMLDVNEVDLMLVSSFMPDTLGVGNAAYLSRELHFKGAAFNLESACSSSLVALQTAAAMVTAKQYRRVLVVISCTYSRTAEDTDTLSWTVGDGAAAFVVTEVDGGLLGVKSVNTSQSCGALLYEMVSTDGGEPRIRIRATEKAGKALREISETCLLPCVEGACSAAGVKFRDIDFFVFNSPVAWYASFCAKALGVEPHKTLDTYREYGNVGPVLMPANLHRAASLGRIKPGSLVLAYTVGSVSSAGAAVMRWADAAL